MNRKKLILFLLLITFALAIGYAWWRMPRQQRVAKLTYTPGAKAAAPRPKTPSAKPALSAPSEAGDDSAVHLALLDRGISFFKGYRRNIFRPVFHEEIKEILPPLTKIAPPPVPPPPPPKPVAPPVVEPTPLQRDMAQFTFLGFMKKDGRKTIFLAKEKDILLVKKGDRVAGKYEAIDITEERLTIKALDGSGEIVIPLVEQKPLMAPRK